MWKMTSQRLMWVLLLMRWVTMVMMTTSNGIQVPDLFPEESISPCFLQKKRLRSSTVKNDCIALCQKTPSCYLACTKRCGQCSLYSATVSPQWKGTGVSHGRCYSLWAEEKNIANDATLTSAYAYSTSSAELAVDGFACSPVREYQFRSRTDKPTHALLATMETSKCIERVVIQTYQKTTIPLAFQDVEVRVGDDQGSDWDFSSNPLLMRYDGKPSYGGEVVIFQGNVPLTGKYISITSPVVLSIMEMKIIEC